MARRSQPYRLKGLPTTSMVEQIDEMFQILFDDTDNGSMRVRSTQITGILPLSKGGTGLTTADVDTGDLLYGDTTLTDKYATLTSVAAGSYLRSGGLLTAPVWSTVTLPNTAVLGDIWYASATNVMSALADVATGNALISGGVGVAPSWGKIGLTTHVSGVLPTANGGTNLATWTAGSIPYLASSSLFAENNAKLFWDNTNKWMGIGINAFTFGQLHCRGEAAANGNIRVSGGAQQVNYIDLFQVSGSSGGLNAVGTQMLLLTGGTTRVTIPNSSVSITLEVPLIATSGGTGFASYAVGDILYASTTSALSKLADVAAGSWLRSGGLNTAPAWSTTTIPNTATTGDLWYASASNVMSALADVSAGSYLRSGGVATAPVWSTVKLPNTATTGDLWYASASNTLSALADVAVGSYLRSGGVSTAPAWSTMTLPDTCAQGDLFYGSATNVVSALAKSTTSTHYLSNAGTSNAPLWDRVSLASGVKDALATSALSNGTWNGTVLDTSTGTQNNLNLSVVGDTYIEWSGASDMTCTGITSGAVGMLIIIRNTGTKVAYFSHNSGSSSAANRLKNLVTSSTTPVAGGGWIAYKHNGTDWQLVGHDQGDYITTAFSAGDYTLSGDRTWTVDSGDVTTNAWKLIGRSFHWVWKVATSTISGGATSGFFKIAIPNSYSPTLGVLSMSSYILVGSTEYVAYANVVAAGTTIGIQAVPAPADFGTGTNNIYVYGQTMFEVT